MNNGFTNIKQVAKKQVMSRTLKRTQKKKMRTIQNIKIYKSNQTIQKVFKYSKKNEPGKSTRRDRARRFMQRDLSHNTVIHYRQ